MLVASIVDDILNGRDAQVGVDHCVGGIPWGVYNCSQYVARAGKKRNF